MSTDADPSLPNRLAWPVWIYLACILLPIRFMLGPLQMTSLRLFTLIFLPVLLWKLARQARIPTDLILLAFVGWTYVAMQVNTPAQAVEHAGITLLELYGGYAIARIYITNAAQFSRLIRAITILILLCLPTAIFETLTGTPILIQAIASLPGINSVDILTIAPRLGLERVQALFAHPIHFGLFSTTMLSLLLIGLRAQMALGWRILGCAFLLLATFLSLSSGAYLSALIQLFLIAWAQGLHRVRHKWLLLLLGCVFAYLFIDLVSNRTPIRVFFSYATFSAHNAYWRGIIFEWGMINIRDNPIFGIGLNDWVRPHFMHSGSMDNFWLAIAVRYGLPGFTLLLAAWVWGLYTVTRSAPHPLKSAWLYCMIGLSFALCTVHIWTAIYSFVFFLFGAGQFLGASRTRNKKLPATTTRQERAQTFTRTSPI